MSRSSSPTYSSRRSSPSRLQTYKAPPSAVRTIAPQAPPSTGPSFGQTIKEGIGYGIGSSIAHNVVGRLFSAPAYTPKNDATTETTVKEATEACSKQRGIFENCLLRESVEFCGEEQNTYTECIKTSRK